MKTVNMLKLFNRYIYIYVIVSNSSNIRTYITYEIICIYMLHVLNNVVVCSTVRKGS